MKKFLLFVLSMLVFSVASADNSYISTQGLTEKQKAELAMKLAEMKETTPAQAPATSAVQINDAAVDGVRKWGSVSTEVAKGLVVGLAAAAKEANIAVNDFAVTPVGRITTAIIVWKMIGHDILRAIAGILLIFIVAPSMWHLYRQIVIEISEYEYQPYLWGIWNRKVPKAQRYDKGDGFLTFLFTVITVACVVAGIILFV